jgi:hypothetical protein
MVAFLPEFIPTSSANPSNKQIGKAVTTAALTEGSPAPHADLHWSTVANNATEMPTAKKFFSSYGQPAVNSKGAVVFRGRSTGGTDRETGIYLRQLGFSTIYARTSLKFAIPYPNNLDTKFREFPSVPRISMNRMNVATRGIHQPVYQYDLPDGSETRVGSTGIYAQLGSNFLLTGASKLGAVPGFEHFAVPNIWPATSFDQFPGAPAITDNGVIAFKGNFSENGRGKTGIFFRSLLNTPGGGTSPVEVIATSDSEIPNAPPSFSILTFDSTAPPSVAGNELVFVGLDNEDDPHFGGIYIADLKPNARLRTLIGLDAGLPGFEKIRLTRVGEGLSFDGRYLAFWGAWGRETKTVRLYCAVDGNADVIAYCNGVDPNSILDVENGKWYQEKEVSINQGIFVLDRRTGITHLVADSNADFNDFVFWGYSGKAPGTGHEEEFDEEDDEGDEAEPPRWRSAAFVNVANGLVNFKARTGALDEKNVYVNPVDGIYMGNVFQPDSLQVILETGMDGAVLDPSLPPGNMEIIGLGIERDGFRGRYLAITAVMANAEEGWGGVYLAHVTPRSPNIKNSKVE